MRYSPETIVLTLSRQCNIECDHCIVVGGRREKGNLDIEIIDHIVSQAKQNNIRSACIYGGEPLLRQKDLLPHVLHVLFREGLSVSLGTNGFWGRTEEQARKVLSDLEKIIAEHKGSLNIGLSVDRFHQPQIPAQSIANIICVHRKGNYPHVCLGIISFQDQESFDIVGQVYEDCQKNGIYLIETNDGHYSYPATREEVIEYDGIHLDEIRKKLDLSGDTGPEEILAIIASLKKTQGGYVDIIIPKIIARHFDIGDGEKNYLIFPDNIFLINLIVEKRVIHAGRARKDQELEMHLDYGNGMDHLVIGPDGFAYKYPAELTSKKGVLVGKRPLSKVIQELENREWN